MKKFSTVVLLVMALTLTVTGIAGAQPPHNSAVYWFTIPNSEAFGIGHGCTQNFELIIHFQIYADEVPSYTCMRLVGPWQSVTPWVPAYDVVSWYNFNGEPDYYAGPGWDTVCYTPSTIGKVNDRWFLTYTVQVMYPSKNTAPSFGLDMQWPDGETEFVGFYKSFLYEACPRPHDTYLPTIMK